MKLKPFLFLLPSPLLAASPDQDSGADVMAPSRLKNLSLEELMDIEVVSVLGIPQKALEAPATMVVITARQIEERGYEEIGNVLRDVKGIDFVHVNGGFPTINAFRGMYGDENRRILLVIDGIVENNLIGGSELGGPAYSLHNVERVEILWGPFSALYGANAFSAVINIIMQKGAGRSGIAYQKGVGSFGTALEKASLEGSHGGFESGGVRIDVPHRGAALREHPPQLLHLLFRQCLFAVGNGVASPENLPDHPGLPRLRRPRRARHPSRLAHGAVRPSRPGTR